MTHPGSGTLAQRPIRSALFLDFDNVYSGLERLDPSAAKAFAEDPGRWVAALTARDGAEGSARRRFLVQRCYLNPGTYSRYRPNFTRAGFQVVDCPSLTQQGKSSADINLVLDAVDALVASTRFEEFVILSADADFTPLILRCRADDRLVTIITPGPAAAAYRAVADTVIGADPFIALLVAGPGSPAGDQGEALISDDRTQLPTADAEPLANAAADAVAESVARADRPVSLARAAAVAQRAEPQLQATQWAGSGNFAGWLRATLPELSVDTRTPGYVWDPARFSGTDVPPSIADDPRSRRSELHRQVAATTDIPLLDKAAYRQLLDQLTFDLATAPFSRTDTSKRVRDSCAESESPVSRAAVNFVINGLLFSGMRLDDAPTAESLAGVWTQNVLGLCEGARIELDEADASDVAAWVSGGLVQR